MNLALYRHMMQLHLKMFFGFGVGSAIYVTLITSLYPLLDDNMEQIDDMMQILPEGMMRAFGMESISNYGQFISAEYYGLFYLLILGVFSVMVAIQLGGRLPAQARIPSPSRSGSPAGSVRVPGGVQAAGTSPRRQSGPRGPAASARRPAAA